MTAALLDGPRARSGGGPADRRTPLLVGAAVAVAAGVGVGVTWSPLVALLITATLVLGGAIAAHPPLAAYLMLGVTPLVAGIDRGRILPLLRPNEALLVLCATALAARLVWDRRAGERWRLRPGLLAGALIAMAVCNSVLPLLWMAVRHEPISGDDLSYAAVLWKFLLLYAVVRVSVRTEAQGRRCLAVSMAVAAAVAVIAILQSLQLFGVGVLLQTFWAPFGDAAALVNSRGSATLGLAAATADLMIFNLALAAIWWRRHRSPWLLVVIPLFLAGALSSGQVSSAIGVVVAIVTLGVVLRRAGITVALALVGLVAALALTPVVMARLQGFAGASGLPDSWVGRLANLRGYFWPRLFEHGNVVFGVQPAARVPAPNTLALPWIWIESGYTWLLWGGGIPLLISFVVVVAVATRQSLVLSRAPGVLGTTAGGVFVAVVVVAVLMVFDPHVTYRGSADLLFMLLALMTALRRASPPAATPVTPTAAPSRDRGRAMTAPTTRSPSAHRGVRLLRARWGWIALTTLVVVAAAAVFSALQPRTFEGTVEVVVLPVVTPDGPAPQTPTMATEKSLITFGVIAVPVAQRLGVPVDELVDAVTVTVPPQSTTMQITCARPEPQAAAACAQALGQAYVQYKDTQPIQTLPERARILSSAAVPTSPTVPNWPVNLLAGVLVGLVLGVLVALLRDRLDTRCRRPEDLERRGLRVLGVVPPTSGAEGRSGDTARAYGALAARLHAAARPLGTAGPVVVVTALDEGGRARGVAAALATALASAGHRVVLVHADTAGGDDGPAGQPGLLDVLAGDLDLDAAIARTAHPHLTHLVLGHRPATRIALRDWSPVAATLAARADVVVVAADPVLDTANGLAVAQGGSAVLAVADARRTTREAVDALLDDGDQLALPLVGSVLVGEHRRRARRSTSGDWARWSEDAAARDEEERAGSSAGPATRQDEATPGTSVVGVGAHPNGNGSGAHPAAPA